MTNAVLRFEASSRWDSGPESFRSWREIVFALVLAVVAALLFAIGAWFVAIWMTAIFVALLFFRPWKVEVAAGYLRLFYLARRSSMVRPGESRIELETAGKITRVRVQSPYVPMTKVAVVFQGKAGETLRSALDSHGWKAEDVHRQ